MPENDRFRHIQVFCPECQKMISPGEYSLCPYFEGGESSLSEEERAFRQIFNCHVKCGTKIEYHYYKDGERVSTTVDPVENEGMLMDILKRVLNRK